MTLIFAVVLGQLAACVVAGLLGFDAGRRHQRRHPEPLRFDNTRHLRRFIDACITAHGHAEDTGSAVVVHAPQEMNQ